VAEATLYIDTWHSTCGACGKNADPAEDSHLNISMRGEGCGAVYVAVSSNYYGLDLSEFHPELPHYELPLPGEES
jgi:hypothetical protein